jgi:predicted nucleotidyltransferase
MAKVMEMTFGPSALLSEELSGIPGVEGAYVFGSWARRYRGDIGHPPRDVDVLVLGAPNRDEVYEAARRVEQRIGLPVQVTFRSQEQWNRTDDPFLETVKDDALMEVPLQ